MILSGVAIAVIAVIAYIWSSRGFLSSLLHMVCVIVAGAIAFAIWEPVAIAIINADSSQSGWLADLAWGLGLAVPFCIILAIIRLISDKVVPFNADLDGVTNMVGGGVCGIVSGVLAAGVIALSISNMRLATTFMGAQTVTWENNGSFKSTGGLPILPVDRLTAWFFSTMSDTTFSTLSGDSLAKWRPGLEQEGSLLRTNFPNPDGGARMTLKPDAFEVLGRYVFQPTDPKQMMTDHFQPERNQTFNYLDGEGASPGSSTVEGFVVRFKSGAKEKSGRIIVAPSQVRLVVRSQDQTNSRAVHPFAMISQAEGDNPALGRWRFDAQNTFISSVGGRDDAPMAFEFVVPRGYEPLGLYVKGVRTDVRGMKNFATYKNQDARAAAITSRAITPTEDLTKVSLSAPKTSWRWVADSADSFVRFSTALGAGYIISRDALHGLEIDPDAKNAIIGGEAKFRIPDLQANRGAVDPKLQVRAFAVTDDTAIVQVVMDIRNDAFGFLSNACADIDRSKGPRVFDNNNTPYSALGYVYETKEEFWIKFSPQQPVASIDELPSLSRSQPNQKLTLLFRVSKGVKLTKIAIGGTVIVEFTPPIDTPAMQ